ncbi:hypothetical protein FRC12_011928 [Ceratobasidium sp. 428]|nr:hypothetical protein FRC12_011928 [Ceratobasidium sp. 428]
MARCDQNPYSRSGFGDVHRGILLNGTRVALKCLRLYVDRSEEYHKALKYAARELHTWSKCRHPNIVELLGLAEFRGQIAMVSPWMENGSVDRLNPEDDTIDRHKLCLEVARGLAYLHEINIVHGDLKARNVLLSDNGGVQLAEFGNAVLASSALLFTESTSTRTGFSIRWAAPEQLQGEVAYSREADIYSLGMTILEIISHHQPYAYIQNEAAVIVAILVKRQRPKRPKDTIPANSQQADALWSLLESCWSWDPKDRPEAPSVLREIETIESKGLLVERLQTSTGSSSPSLTLSPNVPETKRKPETPEGELALWQKRPRLETDKSVQIPTVHRHLITKAIEMLNYVASQRSGRESNHIPEDMPEPGYSANDLTNLLSEMRELGVDTAETAQLEFLSGRLYGFQQKTHRLLLEVKPCRDPDDAASLDRLEIAADQGLRFRLGELPELERMAASLEASRDVQKINVNDLTLDQLEELLLRGQGAGMSSDHRIMAELARRVTTGQKWKANAMAVLAQPQPEMKDLDQLLASARSVPTLLDILGKLTRVWLRGREHEKQVEACLRPPKGMLVQIDDATKVATTALGEVYFPAAEKLRRHSTEARTWEKTCEDIVSGRFKARGNVTVFDEVRAMRDEGKAKSWAFDMPWFEDMVRQLAVHEEWIGRLPWTRPSHPALQLDSILRDVVGDGDADSAPPMNEACTCICLEPVLVIGESAQDTEVVQCDHCLAKFHTKCIEGSCPFCDHHHWDGSIDKPRTFKLHDLILQYKTACELTRHHSLDYNALEFVICKCDALTQAIDKFIKQLSQQGSPDPAVVPQIRHFMRKLYRIQFDVSARPDAPASGLSLVHLHRLAIQPQPQQPQHRPNQKPKFVFKSEVDPEASDGSRCLCSGAAAGLNLSLLGCSECQSLYHIACVALSSTDEAPKPFVCPLCLLKKGKCYGLADVRVSYHDDDPEEDAKFVDVKACLDNYSRGMIRRALPPPVRTTINVRLLGFVPGTNLDVDGPKSHPQLAIETPSNSTQGGPQTGVPAPGACLNSR